MLQHVTKNENDYFMRDNAHSLSSIFTSDAVDDTPNPERNITPTLAARRAIVELPDPRSSFCLLWETLRDPDLCQPVQYAELPFPKAFVQNDRRGGPCHLGGSSRG